MIIKYYFLDKLLLQIILPIWLVRNIYIAQCRMYFSFHETNQGTMLIFKGEWLWV